MRYALALVSAWLLVGTGHAQNTNPLGGAWIVVSTTNGGEDDTQLKNHTATFVDGKVTFKSKEGKVHVAAYTLDASKKPATIDLVPADGPHKGMTLKGIYVLDKSELKLCVGKEGEDRPTAFSSKAGEQTVLLSLKKVAADKPRDGPPPLQELDHGGLFRPAAQGGRDLILLSLAFSPDGKTLASAGGGQLKGRDRGPRGEVNLWDVATGKRLKTIAVPNGIVFHVAFSPDGKLLATASGSGSADPVVPGEVRLWDAATGELVRKGQAHDCGAYVVAFSPDGKFLASGGIATLDKSKIGPVRGQHATGDLKLWDLKTGKELWTRGGHSGTVGSLVFSADGKTLASSGGVFDGKVKLWDVAAGTDLGTLEFKAEVVQPVAFGPGASTLAVLSANPTGNEEGPGFTVRVSRWDTAKSKQIDAVDIKNGAIYRMALSHKGDLIACGCDHGAKVYDVASRVEVRTLPSKLRTRPVAFSPDDETFAAGGDDGTVKLWSVAKLRE